MYWLPTVGKYNKITNTGSVPEYVLYFKYHITQNIPIYTYSETQNIPIYTYSETLALKWDSHHNIFIDTCFRVCIFRDTWSLSIFICASSTFISYKLNVTTIWMNAIVREIFDNVPYLIEKKNMHNDANLCYGIHLLVFSNNNIINANFVCN